jgi:hypothetical protein
LTHHSQRPEDRAVDQKPSLLSKSGLVPLSLDAALLRKRFQKIVHYCGAEACKNNNPIRHHPSIVPSCAIFAGMWVIVREFEELASVSSSAGEA